MYKIILPIIVITILVFSTIIAFGGYFDTEYKKTSSALYDDRIEVVWEVITNLESHVNYKKDVVEIEIIEKSFGNILKWREIISENESREYEIIERKPINKYVVKMRNTKTGLEGIWSYSLSQGNKTQVIISEESTIDNIFWRGVAVLTGRNRIIDQEFKFIRVGLFQKLLKY